MAEIGLQGSGIDAFIGQRAAAGVTEHVGVHCRRSALRDQLSSGDRLYRSLSPDRQTIAPHRIPGVLGLVMDRYGPLIEFCICALLADSYFGAQSLA
jgi:hypothetical protein